MLTQFPQNHEIDCSVEILAQPSTNINAQYHLEQSMLEAAQAYLRAGLSVIPLLPNSKSPAIDWKEYQSRWATDKEIVEWWGKHPEWGIAIVCGKVSNIVVLDIDDYSKFEETVKRLGVKFSSTPVVKTRKGWHVYFRYPSNLHITRCQLLEKYGIELRGDNHYVVAPPTTIDGHTYRWIVKDGKELSIFNVELVEPPKWLLSLCGLLNGQQHSPDHPTDYDGAQHVCNPNGDEAKHQTFFGKYKATKEEIETVVSIVKPYWVKGQRQDVALGLAGLLAKAGWGWESAEEIFNRLRDLSSDEANESEWKRRMDALKSSYDKTAFDPTSVAGASILENYLPQSALDALKQVVYAFRSTIQIDENATDYYLATVFVELVKNTVRWSPQWGWLQFDGRRWKRVSEAEIISHAIDALTHYFLQLIPICGGEKRQVLFKIAYKCQSKHKVHNAVEVAKGVLKVEISEFDTHPYLLNCLNGVVDLRTGELLPHDPKLMLTQLCPVNYNPQAEAPQWEKFLRDVFLEDEQLVAFVQRALGYSLTGDTKEQVFFICWGNGANGKSTLLTTIQKILGDYAKSVARDALLKRERRGDSHPTAIADLVGCRFALLQETEEGKYLDASLVKALTGGDKIKARFMHKDYFEFTPNFKPWLCTNYKPIVTDTTYALWRRLILIPFRAVFDEKRRDPEMPQKLWQEKEGILAWLIRGCLRWQEEGLNPPPVVREATKAYQTEMDVIQQWLEDCCVADPHAITPLADLYDSYQKWCKEREEEPMSKRKFANRLTEKWYDSLDLWDSVLRKSVKARRGIRFKQESDDRNDGWEESRESNPTTPSQEASRSSLCETNFPIFPLMHTNIEENTASKVSTAMSESLREEGEPPPTATSALPEGEKFHNYLSQHDNAKHSEKVEGEEEFFLF